MRVLINGRESRGPGGYIVGVLTVALVLAILFFVVLPLVGIAVVIAATAATVYLGARAVGLLGSRRRKAERDDEAQYRIESSRQHDSIDPL